MDGKLHDGSKDGEKNFTMGEKLGNKVAQWMRYQGKGYKVD